MSLVLLADDLTGALEAGAYFAERGWAATMGLSELPAAREGRALRVESTETRNASPDDARRRVKEALDRMRARGERLLFKKIDSTLRGPVGAELDALREAGLGPVIFAPANPAAGRTVRGGRLLVGGVPVAETPMANDPRMPVRSSALSDIVRMTGDAAGVRFRDAESLADLDRIAAEALALGGAACLVGSGGLALALSRALAVMPTPRAAAEVSGLAARPDTFPAPLPEPGPNKAPCAPVLFVSGSRHPVSHQQVRHLAGAHAPGERPTIKIPPDSGPCSARVPHGVPIVWLEPGADETALVTQLGAALDAHGAACLAAADAADDPLRVSPALARLAAEIARRRQLRALVVSGGETAMAICAALGAVSLAIESPLHGGAVRSHLLTPDGLRRVFITKPGGFGAEDILLRIYATLRP